MTTVQDLLIEWFRVHKRELPWRPQDLNAIRDPYGVWVSESMLQQTQVVSVIPKYLAWMKALPTLQHLAQASESQVLQLWQGLGYYSRAKSLHRSAQILIEMGLDSLPQDETSLRALPGIGSYTIGAIRSLAFHLQSPILDGNLIRIFSRLHQWSHLPTQSSEWKNRYWNESLRWIQNHPAHLINEALMELGATVCTPKKPQCFHCPITRECSASQNQSIHLYPPISRKVSITEVHGSVVWLTCKNQVLLEKSTDGFLAKQWKLPLVMEPALQSPDWINWILMHSQVLAGKALRHSITRYKMILQLRVGEITSPKQFPTQWLNSQEYQWIDINQFNELVANSLSLKAHKKVLLGALTREHHPNGAN